jgi:hypothetical protein
LKRIYLIGNGKSLQRTPLEKCRPAMGVNKIGAIFQPDYYVKVDYSPFNQDADEWLEEVVPMVKSGTPCLLWDVFRDGVKDPNAAFGDWIPKGIGDHPNVTWVSRCNHHEYPPYLRAEWHEPFCTAYNSISVMAQWAVKLGFEEAVLVGCDLGFTDGISDHFAPYYKQVDGNYRERNNKYTLAAHEMILRNCPIPVYNATIGGDLEIHKRVDIHEVLCNW